MGAGRWFGGTIDNLIRVLAACPETAFIGHAPGFWREMSGKADDFAEPYLKPPLEPGGRLPDLFARHGNLYADLSAASALCALQADPRAARNLLLRFPDRFLFGRDYYGAELLDFLGTLDLPEVAWRRIGRENAERLLAGTAR